MPILKLKPACKDYLWGGERLRGEYRVRSDCHPLAEAWMLSCHPDGPSLIQGGPWDGKSLPEYLAQTPAALGSRGAAFAQFPILIKFIDAAGDLSIQVHPSDEYAFAHEGGQQGKTEAWYILDAQPGARLYHGFQGRPSREEVEQAVADGTLTGLLRSVEVHKGDLFFIPSGTVHAIGAGILLAEIQQNSNLTYRLFDYGRLGADGKPRQLHVDKALAVMDRCPPRVDEDFGGHLVRCKYFTTDRLEGDFTAQCGPASFHSLLVLEGEGTLTQGGETLPIGQGDSLFLPADSGEYTVTGSCVLLRTTAGEE
ncbi:MAG: class I mannose-6-phosphate isomerase [Oscillospiraceae bacterium]|nr:class I mannose-6-phosphate isomerase [Oscillospiraceae bacterium]